MEDRGNLVDSAGYTNLNEHQYLGVCLTYLMAKVYDVNSTPSASGSKGLVSSNMQQ
jgi:hypothetical protein